MGVFSQSWVREGVLIFCDLLTKKITKADVNEKNQFLEFYKNCALIGGFQKFITIVKPNGKELKTLRFSSLIRQFKVAPLTGNLLIHNQNQELLCTDMDGKVRWTLERLSICGEIVVSERGQRG